MGLTRILLIGSALCALTACGGAYTAMKEKFTGERKGVYVGGPRRAPLLNPAPTMAAAPVASVEVAPIKDAPAAAKPAAAAQSVEPYNMYDDKGNEIKQESSFFSGSWFGESKAGETKAGTALEAGNEAAAPSVPQTKEAPAVAPAPTNFVPASEIPADTDYDPLEDNGVIMPPSRSQRQDKSSLKNQANQDSQPDAIQLAQLAPSAAPEAALPSLATVPPKPQGVDKIQKHKAEQEQELLNTHERALQQKDDLAKEPSELSPILLPQIEQTIEEIKGALESPTPIITAHNITSSAQ